MTIRSLLRSCSVAALAAITFCACDGNGDAAGTADTTAATGSGVVQTSPNDAPPVDMSKANIDTSDGTLRITGSGRYEGTWSFKDVTGVIEERAFSGKTQSILSLEAHDGVEKRHFRIRMLRDNAPIEPGRYSFSDRNRMADAKFEQGADVYRSLEGATGSVQLESIAGDTARGSFDITLPPLEGDSSGAAQVLKGSFKQALRR